MTIRNVGVVGIGRMGSRMAAHIARAGFQLHIHDLDSAACETVAREHNNVAVLDSPKAVAAESEAVITMLPAGQDVRAVALGENGLADGFAMGGVLVDMSSSQPWLTVALAADLKARGVDMIDAPVSGGIDGAEKGTLTLMVGGDDAVIDRCIPALEPMAGNIFRTGAVGSGHAVKTLNNMMSGMNAMIAAEAVLVGVRFGLDPEVMVDVIDKSTGMNLALTRVIRDQVITRKFGGGFAWDLKFKDFTIAMELARRTGTPIPLSGMAFQLNEAAQNWIGDTSDKTSAEIVRWQEHVVGTEIRKTK
jgi:3-hydroxyisobutyrate dehydrogenase